MSLNKKLLIVGLFVLFCFVTVLSAFAADSVVTSGIDWKSLVTPIFTDVIKGLVTLISAMIIGILKLLYQKYSRNLAATKILDFLVGKAIENQLANPALDNSSLWKQLVAAAEKIGINPKLVKSFETEIIAQVNAYFIAKDNPNTLPPSLLMQASVK